MVPRRLNAKSNRRVQHHSNFLQAALLQDAMGRTPLPSTSTVWVWRHQPRCSQLASLRCRIHRGVFLSLMSGSLAQLFLAFALQTVNLKWETPARAPEVRQARRPTLIFEPNEIFVLRSLTQRP